MPLTITHAKSNTIADFTGTVTVANSSGGTGTALATNLVRPSDWNSGHQITLALTGSEIASLFVFGNGLSSTSGAGGISVGISAEDFYEPWPLPNTNSTLTAPGIGTWYLDPFFLPYGMNSGRVNLFVSNAAGFLNGAVYSAATTGSISRFQTLQNRLAIYQLGSGASTTRLERVWTGSCDMMFSWERRVSNAATSNLTVSNYLTASFPASFDGSGGVTFSTTSQSGTISVGASTGASTLADNLITGVGAYISGARAIPFPMATKIPPGKYWMAHGFSSTSSSAGTGYSTGTMNQTQSVIGLLENNLQGFRTIGQSVSNTSSSPQLFHGFLATVSVDASSIMATSDVRGTTGRMYWNMQR